MRRLRECFLDIAQTCLRVFPWAAEPRLIQVGHPGRDAPVLVTSNYALTLRRVLRALRGQNAYLLVAPTRGINVWCAAAGGHFTAHQVISILRTSGISELVDHRHLILPQLSATGVERKTIEQHAGWHAVFGPVYARDLPAYLANGRKTEIMRQVNFPIHDRLEMAISWAFPVSVGGGIILALVWPRLLLSFVLLVWTLSLGLYTLFPWLPTENERGSQRPPKWVRYLIFFDPAIRRNLLIWGFLVVGMWSYSYWYDSGKVTNLIGWSLASLFVVLLLSMDLAGSTPLYKSGLHDDRLLHIHLNEDACRGRSLCREVCPKNCYVIDNVHHKAVIAEPNACVQCGACIVQCPEDALAFRTLTGHQIPPDVVRKYKLNLLGRRGVSIS